MIPAAEMLNFLAWEGTNRVLSRERERGREILREREREVERPIRRKGNPTKKGIGDRD